MGKEQDNNYYNGVFANSPYYSIEVTAERSRHSKLYAHVLSILEHNSKVLEVGCGTGQFADWIIRSGFDYVQGFDFSDVAVQMSKERTNKDLFQVADVNNWNFATDDYNCIIALEVFEHINNDLEIIGKIPAGRTVIFSLPTFDDTAHVRYFKKAYQITARYSRYFVAWNMVKIGKHHIINAIR